MLLKDSTNVALWYISALRYGYRRAVPFEIRLILWLLKRWARSGINGNSH